MYKQNIGTGQYFHKVCYHVQCFDQIVEAAQITAFVHLYKECYLYFPKQIK